MRVWWCECGCEGAVQWLDGELGTELGKVLDRRGRAGWNWRWEVAGRSKKAGAERGVKDKPRCHGCSDPTYLNQ